MHNDPIHDIGMCLSPAPRPGLEAGLARLGVDAGAVDGHDPGLLPEALIPIRKICTYIV